MNSPTEGPFHKVQRSDFLLRRQLGLEESRREKAKLGNPEWYVIMEPGDEIVCDSCNDLVETETIILNSRGSRVYCQSCKEHIQKFEETDHASNHAE